MRQQRLRRKEEALESCSRSRSRGHRCRSRSCIVGMVRDLPGRSTSCCGERGGGGYGWSKLSLRARDGRHSHSSVSTLQVSYRAREDPYASSYRIRPCRRVESNRVASRLVAVVSVAIAAERGEDGGHHSMRTAQPMAATARCQCHEDAGWELPWPLI